MGNIIVVGSVNIGAFGFQAFFDLDQQKLILDITGQTTFNGSGASAVGGIAFAIIGPGNLVLAAVDFTAPHIVPASQSTYTVDLPGVYGMFGFYTLQGQIKDADAKIYKTAVITKEITKPEGYGIKGYVPGVINIDADCNTPQLLISEATILAYQSKLPLSITKAGLLGYPKGTLADLAFTDTPFMIFGIGHVYTGRYTVNNKTLATYDLADGILVKVPYVVNQLEKVVDCMGSLSRIVCCIEEIKAEYDSAPFSTKGRAAKEKMDKIAFPLYTAIAKQMSGQDPTPEVDEINKALNCDCGCGSAAIEPKLMIGDGLTGNIIVINGQAAAAGITDSTSGNTKTFVIKVKNVVPFNTSSDAAFTISKSETDTQITYGFTFNYSILAHTILTTIQSDNDLTQLLKNILAAANAGISLAGLNSSCVLTIANCNYRLIETTIPAKFINSVTIAGVVRNAPGGLSLTDTASIVSWLSGLGLGSFAATYDATANNTLIETNANPNAVTALSLNISGVTVLRQFTKTCVGLVDILNAITAYICAIDSSKVKFGLTNQKINSYNLDGTVATTSLDPDMSVGAVLANILDAQTVLFNKIVAIALTCANVKTLFKNTTAALTATDKILGTRSDNCGSISWDEAAAQVLASISASPDLKAAFCVIAASCVAPVCAGVTDVNPSISGTTLTVACNNAAPSTSLTIRYRIAGSFGAYTNVVVLAADFPKAITGVSAGQYEVGIQKLCTNGAISDWITGFTAACAVPVTFTVVKSGSNFVVNGTLSGSQTKIEVEMTDPTGGVTVVVNDFGAVSGTFNIPVGDAGYGNYTFRARAVCNDTSTPRFVSTYLTPVVVNFPDPAPGGYSRIAIKMDTSLGSLCAQSAQYVYLNPSFTDINHTVIVFYDSGLTTRVSDKAYITNLAGTIYQINSSGVVGALTGSSC